jgi:hypothetical protein
MRLKAIITLLVVALVYGPLMAAAATRFLDNAASGCGNPSSNYIPSSRSCGSGGVATVYTTMSTALGALTAGDILEIRGGIYSNTIQSTHFTSTGQLGNPITIRRYLTETVTLRVNSCNSSIFFLVNLPNASPHDVTFDGLVLDACGTGPGQDNPGVSVGEGTSNFIFSNIELKNSQGNGYLISGTGHQILGGSVHHNGKGTGYSFSNGIYAGVFINGIIQGVEAYANECQGIRSFQSGNIGTQASGNIIEYNTVHDNGTGKGLDGTAVCGSGGGGISVADNGQTVRYNKVYNNAGQGIQVGGDANPTNHRIFHNSVYANAVGIQVEGGSGNEAINNISVGNTNNWSITSGLSVNLTNRITGTPSVIWTDPANGDLTLKAGSPAIDAGTIIPGYFYSGPLPDQGCCETIGTINLPPSNPQNLRVTQLED